MSLRAPRIRKRGSHHAGRNGGEIRPATPGESRLPALVASGLTAPAAPAQLPPWEQIERVREASRRGVVLDFTGATPAADLGRLRRVCTPPKRLPPPSRTALDYRALPVFRGTVRGAIKSGVTHIGVRTHRLAPAPDLDLDGLFRAEDTIDFPGAS